jgi:hypothetical protein
MTSRNQSRMSSDKKQDSETMVHVDHAVDQHPPAPQGSELPFWKQPELRKLYGMMVFLFLGSTTLGYDGSLLNGLQTMESWRNCKENTPSPSHCHLSEKRTRWKKETS